MTEKQVVERGRDELSDKIDRFHHLFKVGELVQKQVDKGNYFGLLLFAEYALRKSPRLQGALYQAVGYAFQGNTDEEKRNLFYQGLTSYCSDSATNSRKGYGIEETVKNPNGRYSTIPEGFDNTLEYGGEGA